eukprot:s374_g46.t1
MMLTRLTLAMMLFTACSAVRDMKNSVGHVGSREEMGDEMGDEMDVSTSQTGPLKLEQTQNIFAVNEMATEKVKQFVSECLETKPDSLAPCIRTKVNWKEAWKPEEPVGPIGHYGVLVSDSLTYCGNIIHMLKNSMPMGHPGFRSSTPCSAWQLCSQGRFHNLQDNIRNFESSLHREFHGFCT